MSIIENIKFLRAGKGLDGLALDLAAEKARTTDILAVASWYSSHVKALADLVADGERTREATRARAEGRAQESADAGGVALLVEDDVDARALADRWRDRAFEFGAVSADPTARVGFSAVREAIEARIRLLRRVLEERYQAEGEPEAVEALREKVYAAREKAAGFAIKLRDLHHVAALVRSPKYEEEGTKLAAEMAKAEGAAAALADELFESWGVRV